MVDMKCPFGKRISTVTLLLISLFSCKVAFCVRWEPPKEHWSTNEKWVLKVGFRDDETLNLCEKTPDGLKEHWRRGYVGYRRQPYS